MKAGEMFRAGHKFLLSVNGVWLTEKVPPEFLSREHEVKALKPDKQASM